jgi:hypothetical protein
MNIVNVFLVSMPFWPLLFGAVFESIPPHEGVVILRQETIFTSNDVIRVRFDLPLTNWKALGARVHRLVDESKSIATGVRTSISQARLEFAQAGKSLDIDKWLHLLTSKKQPLITLLPSEKVDDSISTSSLGYQAVKKTYYLASPCNEIVTLVNQQTNYEELTSVIEALHNKGTTTTTTKAPGGGRRKRGTEEDIAAGLSIMDNTIQRIQLAVQKGNNVFMTLAEGKFPEECINNDQWTSIAVAIAPKRSLAVEYLKEIYSFLSRFQMTIHRVVKERENDRGTETHVIRVVVLIPAPGSISTLVLRSLRYIPTKVNGNRMTLSEQPTEVMTDLQQRWVTGRPPQEILKERCLPSWTSSTQQWCYRGLELLQSQSMQCVLDALSADN